MVKENKLLDPSDEGTLFQFMLENSHDMISLHGPDGTYMFVSPACYRMFGQQPQELLGTHPFSYIQPSHVARVETAFSSAGEDGDALLIEYPRRKKDGNYLWVEEHISLIRNPKTGEIRELVSVTRDITGRKNEEQNQDWSRNVLQQAEEITRVGGWSFEVNTGHMEWTDGVYRIYGVTRDRYDPNSIRQNIDFYHAEDRQRVEQAFNNLVRRGERYDLEVRFTDASGVHRWVRTSGRAEKRDGEIKRVYGNILDVTDQKNLEAELQERTRLFEQMFMQSSISTQILNKEGWCERINPKLSEHFGVKPERIEGNVYNIFNDEGIRQGGVIPHLERVFREKKTAEWEVFFDIGLASDSTNVLVDEKKKAWFHNWAFPIVDENGALTHVIIQHSDITGRKLMEEELRDKVTQLEKFNRVMVGRELKMMELKKEINKLKELCRASQE